MTELGNKAIKGAFWASIDRFSNMGIQFVVNMLLARLLVPEDFGMVAILNFFIIVSQTLLDSGFNGALIQKKNTSSTDFSTVFTFTLGTSLFMYGVLFFCAPLIAEIFKIPELRPVLRVLGIVLITNSLSSLQTARLRKRLQFKKLALCNITAIVTGTATAVTLAAMGWGVWSLVTMMIVNSVALGVYTTIASRWVPGLMLSRESLKELFSFGGYMLLASILQDVCKNIQNVVIGKSYSTATMGYYAQAQKLDQVFSFSLPQIITQVMYPVYSALQDEPERLASTIDMNVRVISYTVYPILAMLIILASPLIHLLLGPQWDAAIPYYQIMCVGGLFVSLQNVNFYAVAAKGKSRALFLWSFYKWGFLFAAVLVGNLFGIYGLLWGIVASNLNIYLVNAWLASKYSHYPLSRQLRSVGQVLLLTVSAYLVSLSAVSWLDLGEIVQGVLFLGIYFGVSRALHFRAAEECKNLLGKLTQKFRPAPSE